MGPFLGGVVGRKAAAVPGFNYSAAMKSSGLNWDEATLDSFLAAPMKKLPGTSMPVGVAAPKDRADVIAYLATLVSEKGASASPAPAGLPPTATDFVVAGGPSQGANASRPCELVLARPLQLDRPHRHLAGQQRGVECSIVGTVVAIAAGTLNVDHVDVLGFHPQRSRHVCTVADRIDVLPFRFQRFVIDPDACFGIC